MDDIKSFTPDWSSPPGRTIIELATLKGMPIDLLCKQLGLSADCFTKLLSGSHPISVDLAIKLQSHVGATANFWMARDGQYRTDVTRSENCGASAVLSQILPFKEMAKFGWLDGYRRDDGDMAAAMRFLDVAKNDDFFEKYEGLIDALAFRRSAAFDVRIGPLAAWFRAGQLQAERIRCQAWDRNAFAFALTKLRTLTRQRESEVCLSIIQNTCATAGVAVVFVPAPKGCPASGAAFFTNETKGVILLSGRHQTDDHFWFSLFHEAGHLILHCKDDQLYLEGDALTDKIKEDEANHFAASVLIPRLYQRELNLLKANKYDIVRFARTIGISPGIVVGQLQHLGLIRQNQMNFLKRKITLKN